MFFRLISRGINFPEAESRSIQNQGSGENGIWHLNFENTLQLRCRSAAVVEISSVRYKSQTHLVETTAVIAAVGVNVIHL